MHEYKSWIEKKAENKIKQHLKHMIKNKLNSRSLDEYKDKLYVSSEFKILNDKTFGGGLNEMF